MKPTLSQVVAGDIGDLVWHEAGELALPTGRLVQCDPFSFRPAPPFALELAPGNYRVRVMARDNGDLAFLAVHFSNEPIATWSIALAVDEQTDHLRADESVGLRVDSANLALVDDAHQDRIEDARRELCAQMDARARADRACGTFTLGPATVAIVSVGVDGLYPAYQGRDAGGRPVVLVVPLGVPAELPPVLSPSQLEARHRAVEEELRSAVPAHRARAAREAAALRTPALLSRIAVLAVDPGETGTVRTAAACAIAGLLSDVDSLGERLSAALVLPDDPDHGLALVVAAEADDDVWTRWLADGVVALVSDGRSATLATDALLRHPPMKNTAAAQSIRDLVARLRPRLASAEPDLRWNTVRLFARAAAWLDDREVGATIEEGASDPDPRIRALAAAAIATTAARDGFAIDRITAFLEDPSPAVALAASYPFCSSRNLEERSHAPVQRRLKAIARDASLPAEHRERATQLLGWFSV